MSETITYGTFYKKAWEWISEGKFGPPDPLAVRQDRIDDGDRIVSQITGVPISKESLVALGHFVNDVKDHIQDNDYSWIQGPHAWALYKAKVAKNEQRSDTGTPPEAITG